MLARKQPEAGKLPADIVSPTTISSPGNAALWSKLLGKEIKYTGHNFDQWKQGMRAKVQGWSAFNLRIMFQAISIAALHRTK